MEYWDSGDLSGKVVEIFSWMRMDESDWFGVEHDNMGLAGQKDDCR